MIRTKNIKIKVLAMLFFLSGNPLPGQTDTPELSKPITPKIKKVKVLSQIIPQPTPTNVVSLSPDQENSIAASQISKFPIFEEKNKMMSIRTFLDFDEVVNRLKSSEVAEEEYGTTDWRQEYFYIKIKGRIENLPKGSGVLIHYSKLGLVFPHAFPQPGESFYLDCYPQGGQGYRLMEYVQNSPAQKAKIGFTWWYDNGKLSSLNSPDGHHWEWNQQYREFAEGEILSDKQKNGMWTYCWLNGHVKGNGAFQEGKRIGIWNYYYPTDEKYADLEYGDDGQVIHYKAWYVNGNVFCESGQLPRPLTKGVQTDSDLVNSTGKPSLVCYFENGNPMYSYYGLSADAVDPTPDSITNWPNGKAALKHYSIIGEGVCSRFRIELCDPAGGVFFNEEQMNPVGGATTGCPDPILKVVKSKLGTVTDISDGPVTLGIWAIDLSHGFEQKFTPVLVANFENGKLEGLLTVNESDLSAVFPFKDGVLDGEIKVDGETPHAYKFKMGKFIQEDYVNPNP